MRVRRLVPLLALAACEIEKVDIARPTSRVALHGVLSASAESQVVLLERTRNGSVRLFTPSFDLDDPIGSDEGIAETGAAMTLAMPDGRTIVAREDLGFGTGKPNGVYRFALLGDSLRRGGAYRLAVRTATGEELAAESSVPAGTPVRFPAPRTFDRARDTLVYTWPASAGARSYLVRIETPFGPRAFFTDSTHVRLPGELRNVDLDALPHVFIPGFPQMVTVSAVDANYYDWFRSHGDALTGMGLINRVRGGLGVFGALVRLRFDSVTIVAPQRDAASGRFAFVGTELEERTTPYRALELYVESRSARSDQGDALSGRFEKRPSFSNPGCQVCGLLGTIRDRRIELVFLRDWSATDTAEVMTGELRGDTIVGRYRGFGGSARFVRR